MITYFLWATLFCYHAFGTNAETLRAAASRHGLFFGAAINAGDLTQTDYTRTVAEQYNLVTAENACKWGATERARGKFDFSGCDAVYRFAKSSNQAFRGHNLCWGEYNPNWLEQGSFSPNEKRSILQQHITTMVKHYNSTVYGWDVVNEAILDNAQGLKKNVWYPDVPDYVDVAFKAARAAAPKGVKLFYNDYNVGSSTGWSQAKSQKMYDMVKSMQQRGIPIDGVGLQLHIDLNYQYADGVKQNIERYAALGIEVHFTELDISCGDQCDWTTDKAQQQAKVYQDLLQVCLAYPNTCKNFETWGFTDKYTWKGTDQHPLPFDENYKAKPAVQSMLNAFGLSAETLRAAASRHGLFFGAAINAGDLTQTDYTRTVAEQYSLVTAENACKWGATERAHGKFDFSGCDAVYRFAKSSNQAFRGHNLCWGEYNPNWLEQGSFSPNEKRSILQQHITTMVKHYNSTVYGWDVVNEAILDNAQGLKKNVWYPDVPDYIDVAFKAARAAAPKGVKLFYNDYNVGSSTGWSQAKSQKMYDMVKSMQQRGIPIDGVGLQLHIDLNYQYVDGVKQNIERYAALGIEVHFTELDISCGDQCDWTTDKAQQQAKVYQDLLQVCLAYPNTCKNFETWGFTDKYTWKGTDQHPLPFDENYKAKPAVQSMLNVLK